MTQWHGDLHKRKKTGGRHRPFRGKRAYERGSPPSYTRLGERRLKIRGTRGRGVKLALLACNEANVTDPGSGKTKKVDIKDVVENRANRDFQKSGIITKGAIISTPLGNARVTSRPGQDGTVNAVLIKGS